MHYTNTNKRGFTLVELLIVIVVIAILAAISIVAFNGVQQRGRDSARQSDVSNIVKALTAYNADGNNWPANAAEARTALTDYRTANLSPNIISQLQVEEGGTLDSGNKEQYRYRLCQTGSPAAPTGAEIFWFKEQTNDTESSTAGIC